MHDSARKEQICSSHLSTIDHAPASNLDSPADNDACALANPVNSPPLSDYP